MSLWFDALGVLCVAAFQGYLFMFAMRRILPPISPDGKLVSGTALIALIASIGVTGPIGMNSALLPQGSMIGPYGLGLVVGLTVNTFIVLRAESRSRTIREVQPGQSVKVLTPPQGTRQHKSS